MHRRFEDVLIEGDIRNYLSENYRDAALTETEIQTIINKLKHISDYPLYEGNRETFWLIKMCIRDSYHPCGCFRRSG